LRRAKMQNKPKSAEVAVIDWLASYFLGCRFDIEAETDYLRAKYELKSLLEMPKSALDAELKARGKKRIARKGIRKRRAR